MRGFIEELRHRNVFRVGVAYIIAGWLIAQVADLATDAFNAPEWFMQMLIILLLVGLPIALFLAWAYELTPDGVKKAKDLPLDMPKDPRSGRLLNRLTIVTLVIAVAWLGWDKLQQSAEEISSETADSTIVDRSIAVLPFQDFSPDGDHAWFADGLTEEILNSLARTPDLQIASRTSSFAFRGATDDIPAIAAELGVAHILEGSVRRAGDRLRVTAQLIRTADDKHLWSENFDGSSEDSIAIQEKIAYGIARALETAMNPEELAKMVSAGTRSVEAWETYLKGLALYQRNLDTGSEEHIDDAIGHVERAIEIDSGFAEAYLLQAEIWGTQTDTTSTVYIFDGLPMADRRARYRDAIDAAIKYARTDIMRLEAELLAADFDLRLLDKVAIATEIAAFAPEKIESWITLSYVLPAVGEYEKAREAALRGLALKEQFDYLDAATFIEVMQRSSIDDVPELVETFLTKRKLTPNDLYQSHRALLAAGMTERAAEIAETYLRVSDDALGETMVQVRQACAEGRVADADKVFAAAGSYAYSDWLFLKTLGRDDDALEVLLPYDTPDTLPLLSGFLAYRSFEARDFPLLWKTLTAQGINRPSARPMAYRCER